MRLLAPREKGKDKGFPFPYLGANILLATQDHTYIGKALTPKLQMITTKAVHQKLSHYTRKKTNVILKFNLNIFGSVI